MHHASHCRFSLSPDFRHFHDLMNSLLHFHDYMQRVYSQDISRHLGLGHQRFMITAQHCFKLLNGWDDPFQGKVIMKFPKLPQRRKSPYASNRVIEIEDDEVEALMDVAGLSLESAIIIE